MPVSISQLFNKKYDKNPAILSAGGDIVNFNELKKNIERISEKLQKAGAKKGDKIAILCHGGDKTFQIILALAANFICVPINAALKNSEIEKIITDLKIQTLVLPPETNKALKFKNTSCSILKFFIAEDKKELQTKTLSAKKMHQKERSDRELAFIIVTSGTTAKPKYVGLSHQNIMANAVNMKNSLRMGSADRCLDVMPFFHVHGLMAALSALANGGSVICPPKFSQEDFFKWWANSQPTWYTASPTIHQSVLRVANNHKKTIIRNPIRLIRSSSASLAPQILKSLEKTFNAPVLESYGMTEATLQITSNLLPPRQRKAGSAGKPIGLNMMIIGKDGRALKKNQIGEVIIRGKNIIKKYLGKNKDDKTSFYGGWLKTGDLGYLDNDGYLFIVGRIKEMINKGGENISPREIDEIFLSHSSVAQTAAFGYPHKTLGEDIALAVVLKKGRKTTERDLKKYGLKKLSQFKTPTRIIITDNLPRTQTGKIQRVKLYSFFHKKFHQQKPKPRKDIGEKEKKAIKIWREVLKLKEALPEDNFFEAGGDSLSLQELLHRLKKVYSKIDEKTFLKDPRLSSLF